ncbi:hypothetical protein GGR21_001674 [Dysgonomonas hofstadii]|uniref:DUF2975 domain-containing protein n=1 Tax=Dysgonomonas hofstadii TaxID=637886 RepID=A0A840CM71_9BACT|nr:DUF2975 domain-containing protein [Dysgonomonas hofstadii]MBB4035779.1 hypothetical protein [Dysgonomonas hofstadii]
MNTRIKFYCILIAICYVGFFVNMFCNDFDDMKESFIDGANSAREKSSTTPLSVWLEPVAKENTAITLYNKTGNETINTQFEEARIKVNVPTKDVPVYLFIAEIFFMAIAIFLFIAIVAFPIMFFNVVYNITKNKIITDNVIFKIRIMGWTMIALSLFDALMRYINIATAKQVLNIENYKIAGPDLENNIIYLSLGLVTLLLTEILKVSLNLKEEQYLTI